MFGARSVGGGGARGCHPGAVRSGRFGGRDGPGPSGEVAKSFLQPVRGPEAELERLDAEVTGIELRLRAGQLDVHRALRGCAPGLAAWRGMLRGNPAAAKQILRKIVAEPSVMESHPEVQGYRWKGKLNSGALLEGAQKYLGCQGPGPIMETWIRLTSWQGRCVV